ncbi:hypothetical protein CHU32_16025 [Superficieibacter electus]|uniref:Lysozyme inhibitor n=1 Tax=Superficieibacter electus TaxID=2022662 RepID=A0A2P5GN12_9ENTR|nr:hypothetical protein [Superficieibacter electus]POP44610.1 hypothetical protein CHU33_11740 [Superficieibacter electus]POP47501.1 hypothetical protein CHU32_16025 [Superficieibacter electus]
MRKQLLILTISWAACSSVWASSDDAWAEDFKAMKAACLKASQLKKPTVSSDNILFDDSVGYSALVIGGHYPQARLHNKRGSELCLWDRKTKAAHISQADTLLNLKTSRE